MSALRSILRSILRPVRRGASLAPHGQLLPLLVLLAALTPSGCATPAGSSSSSPSLSSPSPSPAKPAAASTEAGHGHSSVDWQPWSPAAFERAKAEDKLLLVFVGTEWCHWCHVMDDKTWGDPAVADLLAREFVTVRVDADQRPDVAERYEEWAWPATAVLTPAARPVVEMKGYRKKEKVLALLAGIVSDHRAGRDVGRRLPPPPEAPAPDTDLAATRDLVERQLDRYYDEEMGGWGRPKKYPLLAPLSHAFYRAARRGEAVWQERALFTLKQQAAIVDPVWGGMYQYSARNDWDHPHYEKLAFMQGWTLQMYADAYRVTGDEALLAPARLTRDYVLNHLRSGEGTFYATQDADVGTRGEQPAMTGDKFYALDDEGRRAAGTPFIDTNIYAEHNGYVIAGLAALAGAADDDAAGAAAVQAATAILASHRAGAGAFLHAADDASGRLYLADQVAMAEALLALFEATADIRWRDEALATVNSMRATLYDDVTGAFFAHTLTGQEVGVFAERRRPFELSVRASRLLVRLSHYSDVEHVEGIATWRDDGLKGLKRFADAETLKPQGRVVGDYLLALEDALHEPIHIAVVASDEQAMSPLYKAALKVHVPGRIVERLRPGGRFPDMGRPAAFVCGEAFCSSPQFAPDALARTAADFVPLKAVPDARAAEGDDGKVSSLEDG